AREEIGVGDPVRPQSVPERACDRVLPDDRVERLRPPLPGEHLVRHLDTREMAVHPPPTAPSCELLTEPAPVRYSHGTREGRLTVAPFRAWRGSTLLVA